MQRRAALITAAIASVVLSGVLLYGAFTWSTRPPPLSADVAYEDVFGFGFWPMWTCVAVLQAAAIALAWRAMSGIRRLGLCTALLLVFAAASLTEQQSWYRAEAQFWSQGRWRCGLTGRPTRTRNSRRRLRRKCCAPVAFNVKPHE